jgi:hypothetical protein
MRTWSTPLLLAFSLVTSTPSFSAVSTAGKQAAPKQLNPEANDPGWPRAITRNGVRLVVYQPQVDEWKDFRELRARVAFTLTPQGGKPAVGIEELQGRTTVNLEARTVLIDKIEIVSTKFPSLPEAEAARLTELLRSTFPGKPLTVSLDRLIASTQAAGSRAESVPVKIDPPAIFTSTEPAILLTVDGKPVLGPIDGVDLKFVVNTNWDLFFAPGTSRYYLLVNKQWLTAGSLDGAWKAVNQLPADFKKLPAGWDRVKNALPPSSQHTKPPRVFFSAVPAELIVFAGQPMFQSIPGTQLAYAKNTDDWVFRDSGGQIYYLVTGRWFRAASLAGPWSYAGNDLPPDFQKIPASSPAADVLASVPGTTEAEDAVLLAQIPTNQVVNRSAAEAKVSVVYQGEPQFAPIEGTDLRYATNTSSTVIQVGNQYFLCANAVWFVSSSPTGPWKTATEVPPTIYTIPPSSPAYRSTYVKIESSNEKEVTTSYTSGYAGAYVAKAGAAAVLVWGTGYYYPPYVYPAPVPIYYPYYPTYGVAATYYPNAGYYATGSYAYGPYNSAGQAAWYNPNTGAYGRAYTTQDPYGGRTNAWGYNPSTGTSWSTQQGHNYNSQWGTSTAERNGQTYQAGHVVTPYGSTGVAAGPNNLYAGHDGNAYKRDDNGDWSKWENGGWQPVNPPQQENQTRQNQQNTNLAQGSAKSPATNSGAPQSAAGKHSSRNQSGNLESQHRGGSQGKARSSELDSSLEKEASARQQGSERTNQQSREQRYGGRGGGLGSSLRNRGSRERFSERR